jgi:hypothetical protein
VTEVSQDTWISARDGPSVHAANRERYGLNGMPASSLMSVLGILLLLQLKHSVFDGPLAALDVAGQGYYGKPGGLAHAGRTVSAPLLLCSMFA